MIYLGTNNNSQRKLLKDQVRVGVRYGSAGLTDKYDYVAPKGINIGNRVEVPVDPHGTGDYITKGLVDSINRVSVGRAAGLKKVE